MIKATYRTMVQTRDWGTVEFTARSAADTLTVVDGVRARALTVAEATDVTVTYQALNAAEADATAHAVHLALSHLAPTDKGRVTLKAPRR